MFWLFSAGGWDICFLFCQGSKGLIVCIRQSCICVSFVGVALALETKHPMFASCASAANNLRNVELEFSDVHQGDIDKLRHPDRGSSCCGRFVASLIQQFLANPMLLETSFTLSQLEDSCLRAVRA